MVHYGEDADSLNSTSALVGSGDDLEVTNLVLAIHLSGLNASTVYYYQLNIANTYNSTLSEINTFTTLLGNT